MGIILKWFYLLPHLSSFLAYSNFSLIGIHIIIRFSRCLSYFLETIIFHLSFNSLLFLNNYINTSLFILIRFIINTIIFFILISRFFMYIFFWYLIFSIKCRTADNTLFLNQISLIYLWTIFISNTSILIIFTIISSSMLFYVYLLTNKLISSFTFFLFCCPKKT